MTRTNRSMMVSVVFCGCTVLGCSSGTGVKKGYEPGFGELMTLIQTRHAKLWFAGEAENWPLASYELDELKEGFDDVAHFHPMFKEVRQPVGHLIATMVDPPLTEAADAIKAQDLEQFTKAYDRLTAGCNGCHTETKFGFNVVIRPTTNPFSNQSFAPPK
jgi:hypothetical protein